MESKMFEGLGPEEKSPNDLTKAMVERIGYQRERGEKIEKKSQREKESRSTKSQKLSSFSVSFSVFTSKGIAQTRTLLSSASLLISFSLNNVVECSSTYSFLPFKYIGVLFDCPNS